MNETAIEVLHDLAVDRCVRRADLLAAGVGRRVISRLLRRRVIARVFRGTYVVGPPRLSQREFLRACVLHAGPGALISHRSGLELRALAQVRRGHAVVTTRRRHVQTYVRAEVPVEGGVGLLRVCQSTPTLPLPSETVDGFETTLLPRTLVDAAGHLGREAMRAPWREATYRAVLDRTAIERQLSRHRRRGQAAIRWLLANRRPVTRPGDHLRSKTGELAFLELIDGSGLPRPEINAPLQIAGRTRYADFLFRLAGLVVETDGPDHDRAEQQAEDAQRDREFRAAGLRVHRIRNDAMAESPADVLADVHRAYEVALQSAARRRAGRGAADRRDGRDLRRAA